MHTKVAVGFLICALLRALSPSFISADLYNLGQSCLSL